MSEETSIFRSIWLSHDPDRPITTVALGCMDYRFAHEFSALQEGGQVVAFRNAGALASETLPEIELLIRWINSINELRILTHADCGAVGLVHKVFQGEITVDENDEVRSKLIRHFSKQLADEKRDPRGQTRQDLERLNSEMKYTAVGPFAGIMNIDLRITATPRDLGQFVIPETPGADNAIALFTTPTNVITHKQIADLVLGSAASETRAYLVQRSLTGAMVDFEIARQIGIRKFALVSLDPLQDAYLERAAYFLRKRPGFGPDEAHVEFVPLHENQMSDELRSLLRSPLEKTPHRIALR